MSIRRIIQFIGLTFIVSFGITQYSQAADTLFYLKSNFETAEDQSQWASEPYDLTKKWEFATGGKGDYQPTTAASGVKNALFCYPEGIFRMLVSPKIDLSFAKKPVLSFQHAMVETGFQDEMFLLLKAGGAASWDTIRRWQEQVGNWTERVINLDEEDAKYLCEDFQVGFLGFSKGFSGIVVDSVVIMESDTVPKFIKSLSYMAANVEAVSGKDIEIPITSKAVQVPLVKVYVRVSGNDGASDLKKISFKLEEGQENYFKANGFSLYHTTGDMYKNEVADTSTKIMGNVSISSGIVTFSGLNHSLKLGDNYLWLAANIADDIDYNSLIRFGVESNSLQFNDTLLPSAAINNVMTTYTSEAVLYDNFDTGLTWDLTTSGGDFEIGAPQGKSFGQTRDPGFAYSGINVLGTDLGGGASDGLYMPNITVGNSYHAISPSVNLKYYNNVKLYFRSWSDFYTDDSTTISISNDGGASWTSVWYNNVDNPGFTPAWTAVILDDDEVSALLNRSEDVKVRFSIGKTTGVPECGFNIDQFTIAGNHIDTDVGITEIISPFNDCIGFDNDTVKVVLRNYAYTATPSRIPVYFALWGTDSTIVRDTVEASIPMGDSIVFSFTPLANFPKGDVYDKFTVGIELEGDEDASNDSLVKLLYIQDSQVPDVLTDFEYKGGVWIPDDEAIWKCAIPGSVSKLPDSPNSWILHPNGNYANNDTRHLTSGCYDLTGANQYIVKFDYELLSEEGKDGFAIQYTTNDGNSWNFVDTSIYGKNWGWYTEEVAALGHIGMSGASGGWASMKEMLPNLSSENKVKFRVLWKSDASTVARGLVFDNFEIFSAPNDIGVVDITRPDSACQYVNEDTVSVTVKNFGANSLQAGDTVIVGIDFESDAPVFDTLTLVSELVPGGTVLFDIPIDMDMDNAGTYSLLAYTLIEDDPDFYGTYNDTLSKQFTVWPNPVSGMADSLFSRQPDTLVIKPYWEAGYTYSWFDAKTDPTHDVDISDIYYSVLITEPVHSCQTKDSTYVELLFNDVGVGEITWPVSSCELNSNELVEVKVMNKGTDSLIVGDKIYVSYFVGSGPVHKDSIVLSSPLYKGQAIDHIFTDTYDFSGIGDYTITAYAEFGGDTLKTNDTIINTISVYGYTEVDLGSDVVSKSLNYPLDAGAGFVEYLWNTDSTTQSIEVTTPGTYWVKATDVNGCADSDTINVFLKIRDVSVDEILNPISSCAREAEESIQLKILNNGTDTINAAEQITVSYSVDGGSLVQEMHTLSADMLPGNSVTHTFSGTIDLGTFKTYDLVTIAQISNDLRVGNDTMIAEVITYETPFVDLGEDRAITNQTQITLDAGAGSNLEYLWYDGSTAQTIEASTSRSYWVTATNTVTGCFDRDTVALLFDVTDYAVQNIDLDDAPCQGEYEDVKVTIANNGTLPREDASIKIGVQVGSKEPVVEQFVANGIWASGTSIDFTLTNPVQLVDVLGKIDVKVYLDQTGDQEPGNDELIKNVDIQDSPDVDFGDDTLQVAFPYELDATAASAAGYLWQDNETTTAKFVATFPALYTVVVTNSNNCRTIESVFLEEGSYVNESTQDDLDVYIYPNPVDDYLNIEVSLDFVDELTIELFDATGRIYFKEESAKSNSYTSQVDVANMSKGMYFLRIRSEDVYFIKTIIIQ